jgi:hypothetical protein
VPHLAEALGRGEPFAQIVVADMGGEVVSVGHCGSLANPAVTRGCGFKLKWLIF